MGNTKVSGPGRRNRRPEDGRWYDALTSAAQADVRAEWRTLMDAARQALDLACEFRTSGRRWFELNDDGQVVESG